MLSESVERLLTDPFVDNAATVAASGAWPAEAWDATEGSGLPLALVAEDAGGFGVDLGDGLALIRRLGYHATRLPIADTMLANLVLDRANLALAAGPAALVPDGDASRVAWGRHAKTFVVQAGSTLARLDDGVSTVALSTNLAGEARDDLGLPELFGGVAIGDLPLLAIGAVGRALLSAGALERVLDLTLSHVRERVQFGRPLANFQAVQQQLAVLASEIAAASAAADHAAAALKYRQSMALGAIAIARVRVADAIDEATTIAHQLHGAMGFTAEHSLHRVTTSLWSWRSEFGGPEYWARLLGAQAMAAGPQAYWHMVVEA
jgi:acyl-CoA dehydrogenase